jgi:hypothetical protein
VSTYQSYGVELLQSLLRSGHAGIEKEKRGRVTISVHNHDDDDDNNDVVDLSRREIPASSRALSAHSAPRDASCCERKQIDNPAE